MSEVEWKKQYHSCGQEYRLIPYVNGKRHGIEKGYRTNGTLDYEDPYVNGVNHGIEKWYHEDGTLRRETIWLRGRPRPDLLGDEYRLTRLVLFGEE